MIDIMLGVPLPRYSPKHMEAGSPVAPAQHNHRKPARLAVGTSVACMALGLCAVVIAV